MMSWGGCSPGSLGQMGDYARRQSIYSAASTSSRGILRPKSAGWA